jgi:hypothetical protein
LSSLSCFTSFVIEWNLMKPIIFPAFFLFLGIKTSSTLPSTHKLVSLKWLLAKKVKSPCLILWMMC